MSLLKKCKKIRPPLVFLGPPFYWTLHANDITSCVRNLLLSLDCISSWWHHNSWVSEWVNEWGMTDRWCLPARPTHHPPFVSSLEMSRRQLWWGDRKTLLFTDVMFSTDLMLETQNRSCEGLIMTAERMWERRTGEVYTQHSQLLPLRR